MEEKSKPEFMCQSEAAEITKVRVTVLDLSLDFGKLFQVSLTLPALWQYERWHVASTGNLSKLMGQGQEDP